MPLCSGSTQRAGSRPQREKSFQVKGLGPTIREKQGQVTLMAKLFLLIKLQELYIRMSSINQPWGELGAERWRNDV